MVCRVNKVERNQFSSSANISMDFAALFRLKDKVKSKIFRLQVIDFVPQDDIAGKCWLNGFDCVVTSDQFQSPLSFLRHLSIRSIKASITARQFNLKISWEILTIFKVAIWQASSCSVKLSHFEWKFYNLFPIFSQLINFLLPSLSINFGKVFVGISFYDDRPQLNFSHNRKNICIRMITTIALNTLIRVSL